MSDPILLEIAAAIGAGRISIRAIHDNVELCHGATLDDGEIAISPIPSTCDTAIHEVLHRLRPEWSERTVRARTAKLMRKITNAELETLYTVLMSSATVKRRPLRLKTDKRGITKEAK